MDEPKALIGRYRFQQLLPGAAKNAIWIARDEQTGQRVVVGSMPIPRARGLVNLVGFEQPHVARVLHILDDAPSDQLPRGITLGNHALLVVEHISGRSLAQRIETASVPLARAVTWLMRAARALREVHARGAVLGAISPRSVIVVRDGVIPAFSHLPASPSGAFCSPARVQGGGPSPEDDVWALHAVLYVALTRSQPFRGASRNELADAILNGRYADLNERGIDDPALSELIQRGFHPSRPRSSAAELEEALLAWIKLGADVEGLRPRASTLPPPSVGNLDDRYVAQSFPEESIGGRPRAQERAPSADHPRIDRTNEPTAPAMPSHILAVANDRVAERRHETWNDRTAPAMAEDIARLAAAHAALAAGEAALLAQSEPPTAGAASRSAADAQSRVFSERPRFDQSDTEGATAPDPDSDAASLDLGEAHAGAGASDQREPSTPVAAPHPPTVVINEPPHGSRMDSLSAAVERLGGDVITEVRAARQPRQAQPAAAASPSPAGRRSLALLAAAAAVAVAVVSLWILRGTKAEAGPKTALSAVRPVSEPLTAASSRRPSGAAPVATTAPAVSAAPSATVSQTATPATLAACVAQYFPEETFNPGAADFGFVCEQADPRQSAKTMHRQIVVGGQGKISAGMREWSLMAWYELGVLAVLQHDCCPNTKPELPTTSGCDPIASSLAAVATSADEAAATKLEGDIVCLYDKQAPRPYRYAARPDSGNKTAFLGFLKRAQEARAAR